MKALFFSVLVLFIFCDTAWADTGILRELAESNRSYEEGRLEEAREGYQRLLKNNPTNGHLHYNLGNAWFGSGNYAKAIQHYLKAQKQLPRDEDVEANLSLALRKTVDIWDGRQTSPASAILFWLHDYTLLEHLQALGLLNLLFWMTHGLRLVRSGESLSKARQILLGVLILGALSTGARWQLESGYEVAVVKEINVDVYSGEEKTDKVILQLHAGAILPVVDRRGEWIELELPDSKTGWVLEQTVLR